MSIVIASEHKGEWGKDLINKILSYAYPDLKLVWKNDPDANLLIRSHFYSYEGKFQGNNLKIPYITWTGESYSVPLRDYPPLCQIEDIILPNSNTNFFYIPYVTDRLWTKDYPYPEFRAYSNNNRPYFLAYCSSRPFPHRENFFRIIRKLSPSTAHGLGRCSNTGHARPEGGWKNLTETYKNYRFAIAMENHNTPGYITEKILNVFIGGAIPIYWGHTETVEKYFNPKAFVNVNKFNSLEEAAQFVVDLDKDLEKRNKMANEPIFKNGKVPDIFRMAEENYVPKDLQKIGDYIKKNLKL